MNMNAPTKKNRVPGTLTKREFYGEEFYKRRQHEYDESRHFLKNCGRPIAEEDKFWITHHKDVVGLNSKYLD